MTLVKSLKIVIVLLMLFAPLTANADASVAKQDPVQTDYQQRLASAIANLERRTESLSDQTLLSYQQELKDLKGNRLVRFYNASTETWTVIEQEGDDISEKQIQIDVPILLTLSMLTNATPIFHSEEDNHLVFEIDSSVSATGEDGNNAELDAAAEKIDQNLRTFLRVHKETLEFSSLEILNSGTFKPSLLATIQEFNVKVTFDQAWSDGPLVAVETVRKLKGKYGLFIGIDEQMTQSLTRFSSSL